MRDMYRASNQKVYTLSDFTVTATPVEVRADGTVALDAPITAGNATPGYGGVGKMAGIPGILVAPCLGRGRTQSQYAIGTTVSRTRRTACYGFTTARARCAL